MAFIVHNIWDNPSHWLTGICFNKRSYNFVYLNWWTQYIYHPVTIPYGSKYFLKSYLTPQIIPQRVPLTPGPYPCALLGPGGAIFNPNQDGSEDRSRGISKPEDGDFARPKWGCNQEWVKWISNQHFWKIVFIQQKGDLSSKKVDFCQVSMRIYTPAIEPGNGKHTTLEIGRYVSWEVPGDLTMEFGDVWGNRQQENPLGGRWCSQQTQSENLGEDSFHCHHRTLW